MKPEVRLPNIVEVNAYVNHPEVYEDNKYDGCPDILDMPDIDEVEYNGLYLGDKMIGLMTLHPGFGGKEVHLSIMKGFRHLARWFSEQVLERESFVYANIPSFNKSVINLAKKVGFKHIGISGTFPKDGIEYPKELLCLKR